MVVKRHGVVFGLLGHISRRTETWSALLQNSLLPLRSRSHPGPLNELMVTSEYPTKKIAPGFFSGRGAKVAVLMTCSFFNVES